MCRLLLISIIAFDIILYEYGDEKTVFSAHLAFSPAYLVITALIRIVVIMICKFNCIKNQIVVNISLVNMSDKCKLALATQYSLCKLHTNPIAF